MYGRTQNTVGKPRFFTNPDFYVDHLVYEATKLFHVLLFQVTNKLFRVVDTDGDGYATADEVMEFLSGVSSSRYNK